MEEVEEKEEERGQRWGRGGRALRGLRWGGVAEEKVEQEEEETMNESCVQSMRCTCRCIGSGGRQEFALSHPRIYPTPASQGAGLWNHPCVRGPLFLVPVFFTDWPPAAEPPVRRSWTEFAWAFAFRSSKPFRSVPTRGPFANHPPGGRWRRRRRRGTTGRSSRGLLQQDKRCAPVYRSDRPEIMPPDIKLLNYPFDLPLLLLAFANPRRANPPILRW